MTDLIHQASHGKLDAARAELQQSARFTFATPYAASGQFLTASSCWRRPTNTFTVSLRLSLEQRIQETLTAADFPIQHHLTEIKYFGPVVIGTFLSELGLPEWFATVDSVVAWFGLDPTVSESANHPTGATHLTKRGTKYGRRMMWLVGRHGVTMSPRDASCS